MIQPGAKVEVTVFTSLNCCSVHCWCVLSFVSFRFIHLAPPKVVSSGCILSVASCMGCACFADVSLSNAITMYPTVSIGADVRFILWFACVASQVINNVQ